MFRTISDPYVGSQITKLYAYIHRFEFELKKMFMNARLKSNVADYQNKIVNILDMYIQTYNDIKSTSKFQSLKKERKEELSYYFAMFCKAMEQ